MKRRAGITLIEVLVAIFVMALGMMALLTLFPLGALQMAQAIQDDRTAACAASADAIATLKAIRNDIVVIKGSSRTDPDVFAADLDDPPYGGGGPLKAPDPNGLSNAILLDPAGYQNAKGTGSQLWVAGAAGGIPRRTLSLGASTIDTSGPDIYRWFTFLDDYEFDRTFGTPSFPVTRDLIYSWAYLLQRPKTSEPSVVNMAVLVFKRRPLSLTGSLNLREFLYSGKDAFGAPLVKFDFTRNVVTVDYSTIGEMPLRAGDWLMDASIGVTAAGFREQHANFYRIVSVTDLSDTQVEIELATSLRGFSAGTNYAPAVLAFDGLVDVFERRTGWK